MCEFYDSANAGFVISIRYESICNPSSFSQLIRATDVGSRLNSCRLTWVENEKICSLTVIPYLEMKDHMSRSLSV